MSDTSFTFQTQSTDGLTAEIAALSARTVAGVVASANNYDTQALATAIAPDLPSLIGTTVLSAALIATFAGDGTAVTTLDGVDQFGTVTANDVARASLVGVPVTVRTGTNSGTIFTVTTTGPFTVVTTPDDSQLLITLTALELLQWDNGSTTWSPFPAASTATYTPTTTADWTGADPTTIGGALDRIAAALGPIA